MPALLLAVAAAAAAAAADPPPAAPLKGLDQVVTDAIRACPGGEGGAVVVCARDRGFAEGYRLPKLSRPKPLASGPAITIVAAPGSSGACSDGTSVGTLTCGSAAGDAQAAWQREQARQHRDQPDK